MSDADLERALFHLYLHIHEYDGYSPAIFAQFSLTRNELEWLKTLMATQREGLLVFNQQLRNKHYRYIKQSLPQSAERFNGELDSLVASYASSEIEIGPREPAVALRTFSDYLSRSIAPANVGFSAFEFISVECLCVSMALHVGLRCRHPDVVHPDARRWFLPPRDYCRVFSCSYDAISSWRADCRPTGNIDKSQRYILFLDDDSHLRLVKLSCQLFKLLQAMEEGLSVADALVK